NSNGSTNPLATTYPVNTLMELKLSPNGETIRGLIYCTDEISNSIVLKKSLVHTTLSSEITVVNAASVLEKKTMDISIIGGSEEDGDEAAAAARELAGVSDLDELKLPLPNVSRKALEERERRAMRLAEESFSHVNQKASPEGQKIFDKLLKACNEVVWKGESILVLKEIRVDPPYTPDYCSLIAGGSGGLDEHSLERVKKIVMAASTSS
ncbi:hypothetical protein ACHAXR_000601, partial [Thalassiosira sp. AJA248-18]